MKENEKDINNMQQLADTGWKQMHEMLRKHGLSTDISVPEVVSKRRNLFPLLAASVLFILIFSFPYILNDKFHFSSNTVFNSTLNETNSAAPKKTVTITQSVKMISRIPGSSIFSQRQNISAGKLNTVFIDTKKEQFTISIQPQNEAYLYKISGKEIPPAIIIKKTVKKNAADSININSAPATPKKSKVRDSKKVQFFAGAGINISAWNKDPHSFNFNDLNIHPGFTVIIPLDKKLSLHTGIWAFSTVHGKEASAKEREMVYSMGPDIYYNVKTTTIVKAAYFDVPLTLHYSINKNWSVGSGLQLSKLYKMNIRQQKESFDYNDTRFSASVQQYNSTPTQAAIVLQRKAEIKNYEPRFVAEANYQQDKWLLSAGYYYGLGKTITLKDADNTRHEYRNEYLKLGIQYRIGRK